jgi:hypothetical protein
LISQPPPRVVDDEDGRQALPGAHSTERDRDQTAAQQRQAGCGKDEESFGMTIAVVTHETPVASAPGNAANQLIKTFGIPRIGQEFQPATA